MQARMHWASHWASPWATHWASHWATRTILWATLILSLPVLTAVSIGQESRAAGQTPARTAPAEAGLHDLSALDASQRVVYLSNRRAMEWLWRANRPDVLIASKEVASFAG